MKDGLVWRRVVHRPQLAAMAAVALLLAGCQPSGVLRSATPIAERIDPAQVILMEPDVELAELTAGGLLEVKADWTAAGRTHVERAVDDFMREHDTSLQRVAQPLEGSPERERYDQLVLLHQVVGVSILQHKYIAPLALPSKGTGFDWTLGDAVAPLRSGSDAGYALFVYLHDSYASPGRVGAMIVAAAFGVGIAGGAQVGFASLVDLDSGDIVWFNRLVSTTGDLRDAPSAREAVDLLLAEFPL